MEKFIEEEKKRLIYYDLLNVVACISVIAMHCNGIVHSYANTIEWKESLVVEVIAYWAVPIFFMLSGATLIEYRAKYTTRTFLKKRVEKTLIPFVAWSFLMLLYKCFNGVISYNALSVKEVFSRFINCSIENVYWFFVPLFAVYLCIPVLSSLSQGKNNCLEYMAIMGIVTISILPFLCNIMGIPYNSAFTFPMTGGYVLYAILGYLLSKVELTSKKRIMIYLMGAAGAIARYCGTYFGTITTGELNKVFWGYLNWPCLLLSVGVFVWFRYHDWTFLENNVWIRKIITEVASASFGVYLIHILVMNILRDLLDANIYGWKWRTIGIALVYFSSLCVVKVMQKIPILRRIVP